MADQKVMKRVVKKFTEAAISLDELGRRMGYPNESARKSAWQFIHKTKDPRVSMLARFAKALEIDIKELF